MSAPLVAGTRVTATVYGEPRRGTVVRHQNPAIVWVQWDFKVYATWHHATSLTVIPRDCASVGCPNDATHRAHGDTGVALEVCAACLQDMRAAIDAGDCPSCGQRADCANGCQYPMPSDFHPINAECAK